MATEVQNGTTAALTIGSATALNTTINAAGTYLVEVDLSNAQDGDAGEVWEEKKVTSGASSAIKGLAPAGFGGPAPGTRRLVTLPVVCAANEALTFYIKQTAGSGRTFPWSVKSL